jgi:hypothetical protein
MWTDETYFIGRAMAQECLPGLSPRRTGIVHGSVNVGFMVDKMALGQGFSEFFDSPRQYHSAADIHTHVSLGGCKIGLLVAAIQRHSLTTLTQATHEQRKNVQEEKRSVISSTSSMPTWDDKKWRHNCNDPLRIQTPRRAPDTPVLSATVVTQLSRLDCAQFKSFNSDKFKETFSNKTVSPSTVISSI